jgi:hypothetical protein
MATDEAEVPPYVPQTQFEAVILAKLRDLSERIARFEVTQEVAIATSQRAEHASKASLNVSIVIRELLAEVRADCHNLADGADQARRYAELAAARADNAAAIAKSALGDGDRPTPMPLAGQ